MESSAGADGQMIELQTACWHASNFLAGLWLLMAVCAAESICAALVLRFRSNLLRVQRVGVPRWRGIMCIVSCMFSIIGFIV